MRRLFEAADDLTGNLPPMPAVFPDMLAPVVRVADGMRRLEPMRWGMPGPPQFGGAPVTNIRNTTSPHWRRWLGPASRCLVPVTSFCEWAQTKPKKTPTWFALDDDRPLFAFAGIWTTWTGVRGTKANPVEGEHRLYGFLTTDANGIVGRASQGHAGASRHRRGAGRMAPRAVERGGGAPASARRRDDAHCGLWLDRRRCRHRQERGASVARPGEPFLSAARKTAGDLHVLRLRAVGTSRKRCCFSAEPGDDP